MSTGLIGTVHLRDPSSRNGPQNVHSQSCQLPAQSSSLSCTRFFSQTQVHAVGVAASLSAIYTGDSIAFNGKHCGHFSLEGAKRLSQNGYGLCHHRKFTSEQQHECNDRKTSCTKSRHNRFLKDVLAAYMDQRLRGHMRLLT